MLNGNYQSLDEMAAHIAEILQDHENRIARVEDHLTEEVSAEKAESAPEAGGKKSKQGK